MPSARGTTVSAAPWLVLAAVACANPVADQLPFACERSVDCAPGYLCSGGKCEAACRGNCDDHGTSSGGTFGASAAASASTSASSSSVVGAVALSAAAGSSSTGTPSSGGAASATSSAGGNSSSQPQCLVDQDCVAGGVQGTICENYACIRGDCHNDYDCAASNTLCVGYSCSPCTSTPACQAFYGTGAECLSGVCGSPPCEPVPGSCDAPPAYCNQVTWGLDSCGHACSKTGPAFCYVTHQACLNDGPGQPTNTPECDSPTGQYDCGLWAGPSGCPEEPFRNTIGADCTYCTRTECTEVSGRDRARFHCRNPPMPPTP